MATNLNWFVLIWAWIIDSINPCAIGVMVFLLAFLVESNKKPIELLKHGLVYLLAVFLTYLLAWVLLLPIIQSLGNFSANAYLGFAAIIWIFGLMEIKEYYSPGETSILEIPPKYSVMIKKWKHKILESYPMTFALGAFVAIVELPCTGAVYLAILALMSKAWVSVSNIVMLIAYNLLFILPLIVILFLFYRGMTSEKITTTVDKYKPYMRLATWLLLLALAWWMLAFTYL